MVSDNGYSSTDLSFFYANYEDREKFNQIYDYELTPGERRAIHLFLAEGDQPSHESLKSFGLLTVSRENRAINPSNPNFRKHLSNACNKFGLRNQPGQKNTFRQELIDLFLKHKPELINQDVFKDSKKYIVALDHLEVSADDSLTHINDETPYIERPPIEDVCYHALLNPGGLLRIKAPRYMGKTQLLHYILNRLRQRANYQVVEIDFGSKDRTVFSDLRRFLRLLCFEVGQQIGATNRLKDHWEDEFIGPNDNTTQYFENYLIPYQSKPLVIALDGVDAVFNHEVVREDFCSLLRGWFEKTKDIGSPTGQNWRKIRLVIIHSTEVYGKGWQLHASPLHNVGEDVELRDFTLEEIKTLEDQFYGLELPSEQIEQFMNVIGGHPYLWKLILDALANSQSSSEELETVLPTEAGPLADHLRNQLYNLKQSGLLAQYQKIVTSEQPISLDSIDAFQLESLGLIKQNVNGCIPRYSLYQSYFQKIFQA